ncbi:hypothetical protein ACKI1Q_44575, partial [Streptomyces galilaeus]|uniref:hypothetical protein n=1 Tax=Streptomyces galilaeus TaxID=33899 RepID=UPI0038F7A457
IGVASLTALFERDLPILTLLLGLVPIGWMMTAIGTGETHALLGVVFLLAAYLLGMGTLLAVWASCEWSGRDLDIASLTDLASQSSLHA